MNIVDVTLINTLLDNIQFIPFKIFYMYLSVHLLSNEHVNLMLNSSQDFNFSLGFDSLHSTNNFVATCILQNFCCNEIKFASKRFLCKTARSKFRVILKKLSVDLVNCFSFFRVKLLFLPPMNNAPI